MKSSIGRARIKVFTQSYFAPWHVGIMMSSLIKCNKTFRCTNRFLLLELTEWFIITLVTFSFFIWTSPIEGLGHRLSYQTFADSKRRVRPGEKLQVSFHNLEINVHYLAQPVCLWVLPLFQFHYSCLPCSILHSAWYPISKSGFWPFCIWVSHLYAPCFIHMALLPQETGSLFSIQMLKCNKAHSYSCKGT